MYCGEIKKGKKSGEGIYYLKNGEIYKGFFHNNVPHGIGTCFYKNKTIKFIGEFYRGKKSGEGIYYFESGEIYEGSFENGIFNGEGKLFKNNTLMYEGSFFNGLYHGEGKYYFLPGEIYENHVYIGTFYEGKFNEKFYFELEFDEELSLLDKSILSSLLE